MITPVPMQGCRPLSGLEVVSMAEAFSRRKSLRDICLFVLGVSCGLRISELLALRVRDVWQGGKAVEFLTIKQTKTGNTRTLELCDDDKAVIASQVKALRRAGYYAGGTMLFRSREGRNSAISRERAWQIIHDTARALGLDGKIGTHTMRKTFANNTYEAILEMGGEDALLNTAEAGGWVSVDGCRRYLSFRRKPQQHAKERNTGQFGTLPQPDGVGA